MVYRNSRFLPVALVAVGLGIAGWYGLEWYELPEYSEAELEQSTELNLAMDIARMGPHLRPEGEKLERLRAQVRAEVEADVKRQRNGVKSWLTIGAMALAAGLAQLAFAHVIERGRKRP